MEAKAMKMVAGVLSDRKHANDVVELLALLEENNTSVVRIVSSGLCAFFARTLSEEKTKKDQLKSQEAQLFLDWARERYREFLTKELDFVNCETDVQDIGFISCVIMIEREMMCSPDSAEKIITTFLVGLMTCKQLSTLKNRIADIMQLVDLRYFVLKIMPKCIQESLKVQSNQLVIQNTYLILENISKIMTSEKIEPEGSRRLLLYQGNLKDVIPECAIDYDNEQCPEVRKYVNFKGIRTAFGKSWLEFLRLNLDNRTVKQTLCLMQKHIIPNFAGPCVLTDFFTKCFHQGGGIALLSLHGLFVLMAEHNLEYPNFYKQLYGTIHPRIFDARYQSRFFYLLDIFLSSSHLPSYLIAAFAKKLSRLLLVAPTYAQPVLVNFILTLMERHPSVKVLINRPKSTQSKESLMNGDPYLPSQDDPALCKALESSLWELAVLNHHFLPQVTECVKELNKGPQQDIHSLLDDTYLDIFDSLTQKDFKDAPMNYKKPRGLFGGFEDVTADVWSL